MGQKGFYYDATFCTGCKACQIACKDKNDLYVGELFRQVFDFEGGIYPDVWGYSLSVGCNHCDKPKCAENCPTGAIYKRQSDGLVVQDRKKCIGCKMCIWSCPYGRPQYLAKQGKSGKCDGCADLVDQGLNPVCVDTCPLRAIEFGDIEELRKKYGTNADMKGLPTSATTKPNMVIKAKKL